MEEIYVYLDNLNPIVPLSVFLGLYLILRYIGRKHLKNLEN